MNKKTGALRRITKEVSELFRSQLSRLPVNNNSPSIILPSGLFVGRDDNARVYTREAFNINSTVYSCITRTASKFGGIPVNVYRRTRDKKAFNEYYYLSKAGDWGRAMKVRKKALELAEDTPLAKLLDRPNPLQGKSAFFENLMGFKMLTGAGTAWANRPTGGAPLELWCLPSQDIVIIVEGQDYLVPAGYQLQTNYITNIRAEDILYWKYFNPNWDTNGSHMYGFAPLRAGFPEVREDETAKKSSQNLMANQGARGVVYNDGQILFSPEERDAMRERFDNMVNGNRNAGNIALANAKLGYLNFGQTSVEMDIKGIRSVTKEGIANVFNYPYRFLSSADGTGLNNSETEMTMKMWVTNKIIPEWVSLRDDINPWLQKMYKDPTLWVEPDFTLLPELQKDILKLSQALENIWQLTPNQKLDYLGFEIDENDPAMNMRYAPANIVRLDDIAFGAGNVDGDIENLNDSGNNDYGR